ncbi:ribokinase [Planctomycetota bacterium]
MAGELAKVVVVGPSYVDLAMRCEHYPGSGQSVCGTGLSYSATGPGPNQAVEAALCGCQVHLISKVGGDPFGEMAKQCLCDFKVNIDFVYTAEVKNTGTVVTLVNGVGENAACVYTGANGALLPVEIDKAEDTIASANVCLIYGYLPHDAVIAAIRSAQMHGTRVILNPAKPIEQNFDSVVDLPGEYFSDTILIANLDEAADITNHGDANVRTAKLIGSDMVARGALAAVITMGKRGCMVVDRDGADHIKAFEIELLDHTGIGDAFAGALAASCAVGDDIRKAVKFASAAGALACTKFGSIEALPGKAEIIELLQKEDMG